jgi:CubicO group peptidase (beta-lactamase class C family)
MSIEEMAPKRSGAIDGFRKEDLAGFTAKFHGMVDEGKLANIVTLIARHGEIAHCDAYGVLDISATPKVPVKTDSIFRIASMLKPITAVAMMMLWEEGKWALDEPVFKFIPEFEGLKVRQDDGVLIPQESPMTMKQLMSHSAGFGARSEYPDLRNGDLQDMINFLATQPLSFQPGKGWRYGPSVDIQGYILQKITGQLLDDFLEQRIFQPLGMVDSGFVLPASKVGRLVNNHEHTENGELKAISMPGTYNAAKPKFLGAGGGLMLSTVKDYWRFAQMILNGGGLEGKRYLKASTVEMMHTNALEQGVSVTMARRPLTGLGFGLGFAIVQDSSVVRTSQGTGSFFWMGLYGTWFWIDPINDLIVIGFVNDVNRASPTASWGLREISAQLVYKALRDSEDD